MCVYELPNPTRSMVFQKRARRQVGFFGSNLPEVGEAIGQESFFCLFQTFCYYLRFGGRRAGCVRGTKRQLTPIGLHRRPGAQCLC